MKDQPWPVYLGVGIIAAFMIILGLTSCNFSPTAPTERPDAEQKCRLYTFTQDGRDSSFFKPCETTGPRTAAMEGK